ncbi:MAG TPA: hypothetical protein VIK71_09945 [Flavobacteriales bacterium]|jgi:hypothetical protein
MKHRRYTIVFAVLGILAIGCLKKESYPDEPSLVLKELIMENDSIKAIVLSYIDGDGNFGLEENEHANDTNDCRKRYNLFIDPYELRNGNWVNISEDPCGPNIPLYYAVPWVKPTGQIPTQKGDIKIDLMYPFYEINEYDTIRLEMYIVDRSNNKSNVVSTHPFLKK